LRVEWGGWSGEGRYEFKKNLSCELNMQEGLRTALWTFFRNSVEGNIPET
jgi:hypothetical protein